MAPRGGSLQQLPAVEAGEHHVEDDQVIFLLLDKVTAMDTIERHVHGKTRLGQAFGEEIEVLASSSLTSKRMAHLDYSDTQARRLRRRCPLQTCNQTDEVLTRTAN